MSYCSSIRWVKTSKQAKKTVVATWQTQTRQIFSNLTFHQSDQNVCQTERQNFCQVKFAKDLPDRTPYLMPDRTPEATPEEITDNRMPECMPGFMWRGGRSKQRIVLSLCLLFSVFRFCLFHNKRLFFLNLITIRKFWSQSENSVCDQKIHSITVFFSIWSQSENSDCDQKIHSISVFFLNFASKISKIEGKNRLLNLIEWIFWSQSEFSDCDQKILICIFFGEQSENSDHNQKILTTNQNNSDHKQKILITIRNFWSQSETADHNQNNSDHNQKILFTIRNFWSHQKLLITIRKFWSQSENSDLHYFFG